MKSLWYIQSPALEKVEDYGMKLTYAMLLVLWVCAGLAPEVLAQAPIRAKTEAGKEVVLYPDGTWKDAEEAKAQPSATRNYQKPRTAKTLFQPSRGKFKIWYDENKWALSKAVPDADGRTQFRLLSGDGYVMVIAEGLSIPLETLKQLAFDNAKGAAPDALIVAEEKRTVNGKEILFMRIDGTVRQIPFTYYGYYYGGNEGTIQVIAFTGQNLIDKYKEEFTNFLNGLEIVP